MRPGACGRESETNDEVHFDGGCRIVTTGRTTCDLLEVRSRNELHVHRSKPASFPFAASVENISR